MENAVKALLIAAAVIIAVLIISLVMGVFNTGAEQVGNNSDLSEYEIQKFNDKFIQYEGKNKSASEVNAMIKTVHNHNGQQEDLSTWVSIVDNSGNGAGITIPATMPAAGTVTTSPKTVKAGQVYKITVSYQNNIVKTITIE